MPTAKDYVTAIEESYGIVSVVARKLGVSRSAVYRARDTYASVYQALIDARERMTDLAEGKLLEKINAGDRGSILFYLETQGKARGYCKKAEYEQVQINLNKPAHELTDAELEQLLRDRGLLSDDEVWQEL